MKRRAPALRGFGMGSARPAAANVIRFEKPAPMQLSAGECEVPRYPQGTPGRPVVEEAKAAVAEKPNMRFVDDKSGIKQVSDGTEKQGMQTKPGFIASLPLPVKIGGALLIGYVAYQLVKEE